MKKVKKAISLLLTCALLVGCMCLPAHATVSPQLVVSSINSYDAASGIGTENISGASAGDFIIVTVGVNVGGTAVNVAGGQIYLKYDANVFAPMKTGTAPFKATYYTTTGTSIADYGWSIVAGNPAGIVSIVGGGSADLAYEAAEGETVSFARIAFKVLADVESVKTAFSFDSASDNTIFCYPEGSSSTTELSGLDKNATYELDIKGVTPTLETVALDKNSVTVEGGTADPQTVQATATSAKGTDITKGVIWTVSPENQGVTVDANGVVSVGAKAVAATYTITATPDGTNSQGSAVNATLKVDRAPSVATSVEVSGQTEIGVPTAAVGEAKTSAFTATVKDQFDSEIKDASVTWSVSEATDVSIDEYGVVAVTNKAQPGEVTVTATTSNGKTGSAKLTITKAASEPETVVVEDGSIEVPTVAEGGKAESTFTATVTDQFGDEMKGASVTWSIEDAPAGVTINSTTGVVTVTNKAAATTGDGITVTATASNDKTGSAKLTITKAASAATSIKVFANGAEVSSSDTIGIPGEKTYTAKVYDQFGDPMADAALNLTKADDGITLDGSKVIVAAGTKDDAKATLTASYTGVSDVVITITAKQVSVDWSVITLKTPATITYGNAKASAFTALPATGTATAYVDGVATTVNGTFAIVEPDTFLTKGEQTITVEFTVTTAGTYQGSKFPQNYTVTVNPKPITVEVTAVSREYGALNPTFTATCPGLVGKDTIDGLGLGLTTTADTSSAPGKYDVSGDGSYNENYAVTINGTEKLTVTKAALTLTGTPTGLGAVLANDAKNTTAEALLNAVQTANPTLAASYANGTATLNAEWALTSGTWSAKGGTYTYTGTLTPADSEKFTYTGADATLNVTVTPVTVTAISGVPTAITKAQGEVTGSLTAVGFPESVTLTYDNGVTVPASVTATWDKSIDDLTALAGQVTDAQNQSTVVTLTNACLPAWATYTGTMPATTFTITSKYPVNVTVTAAGKTYDGTAVATPTAKATAADNGLAASSEWKFTYTGKVADGTAYNSAEAPKDAGSYTVTAEYISTTHYGKASASFTIAPRTIMLNWADPESPIYDSTAKTVTATAAGLIGTDTCTVTLTGNSAINAGEYTAVATGLSNANYALPEAKSHDYTIAKAARDLTVSPETLILVPGALTGSIDASTSASTNMDNSAKFTYTCNDTTVAMVNGTGKVTAAGNGSTTITVTIGETNNYVAASKDVAVKAVTEPVTGVTVTGGKLTAVVSGTAIKVTGTTSDKDALGYHFTTPVVDGIAITVSDVVDGKATVTVNGTELTYTVDTSAVTVLPEVIDEITEKTTGTTGVTVEGVKDALPQSVIDKAAEEAAKNEGVTDVTIGISVEVTQDEDGKLTITPKYSVEGKDADGKTVVLVPETELPSITQPVTVTVPTELDGEDLYAKHTLPNGQVEYLPVTVESGKAIFQTDDLSGTFELVKNSDSIEITFIYADGSTQVITYSAENVGKALPTDSKSGYTFNGWNIGGSIYKTVTEELLKLDDSTAAGSFSSNSSGGGSSGGGSSSSKVTVTVKTPTGATIDPDGKVSVTKGNDQTFTITPKAGYEIKDILVDGKSVMDDAVAKKNGVYTYTMEEIKAAHTLTVKTAQVQSGWPFVDVADDFWARDAIEWAYDNGYMNGYSSTIFNPSGSVTRQQLWMILARLSGQQPANMAEAKAWAVANGVSDGSNPGNAVTRQQMVTILYRYASLMGYKTSGTTDLAAFPDYTSVATYAQDSISWAVANGIVTGTSDGKLNPGGTANRAQFAAILKRFCENIVE